MAHSLAAPNHSKLRLSSVLFASPTRRDYNIMIPYHLINMTSPRIHMNRSRARLVRAMQSPGSNSAEPTPGNIPKVMNLNYTSGPGLPKFSLLNFPTWLQWILGTIIFVALPTYKRFLKIEAGRGERLANIIGCVLGTLPTKYLGLPLSTGRISKADWQGVISKIEGRIEGWQAKLLSQGGRLVLVNSVLANLPLYFFSIFQAPKWVVRRIEALRRAFFWKGGVNINGGQCLVSWKVVCRQKNDGGLGVKDLELMNLALLVKWWWRFFDTSLKLWPSLIESIYYNRRKPLNEGPSFKPRSQWWRSVLATRTIFKCGTTHLVGDGARTNLWSDIWIGNASLHCQFPLIHRAIHNTNYRVKDCFGVRGWKWRKILAGFSTSSLDEEDLLRKFKETLAGTQLSDGSDGFSWRWSQSELFTVKSTYLFLQDTGVSDKRFVRLWKLKLPLKVKIFVWLVLRRRVRTTDTLLRRGWTGDGHCVFCLDSLETADHLFVGCNTGSSLLKRVLMNKVGFQNGSTVDWLWERSNGKKELTAIASTWWTLWLERNRRRFEDKKRGPGILLAEIRDYRLLWASHCA